MNDAPDAADAPSMPSTDAALKRLAVAIVLIGAGSVIAIANGTSDSWLGFMGLMAGLLLIIIAIIRVVPVVKGVA